MSTVPRGEVIGGFAVEDLAGVGGMGVVYRATDLELPRTVALKLIAPERAGDPVLRELFVRESLTAARLEHPNVIPIYRAGEDEGRLFIAMRFVEGASLHDLIAADAGGIPPGRAARIVARVADALDAAHARGLVHRDVKPANILIADPDGEEHVYLTDFGLSIANRPGSREDGGGWAGTLAYLAPEQIDGGPLDARTDVYALGCVLFHALTGREPFPGDEEAVLAAHRSGPPPAPSSVVPGLPPAMDTVVQRAMATKPEDRFATAGELGRAALSARYDAALIIDEPDRASAEEVAAALTDAGLHARIASGGGAEAAEDVRASCACAVVVGRGGLGDWARTGLSAARELAARDRAFRLALILLPGAPDPADPSLAYLANHPWIDLRAGVPDALSPSDLVRALRGADVPAGLPAEVGECPYRGLEAFREEDAALYFGREQDTAQLIERLRATRFVAVLGPSGSGKSSLVRAGLLPAVRRGAIPGGEAWRVVEVVPGEHPLGALAAGLGQLAGAGAPTAQDLAADERALDLAAARSLDGRPPGERVLVLVDQLEEAFTLCADEGGRAAFLGNLVYASTIPGGRVVVVASMRADFYHRLAEHPELRALASTHQHLVGPMDARSLRRAIEEPARRAGLELEPGLTRRILTDVSGRPGTLPLLEHLLVELWNRRRERTLTLEAYAASGGVEGALARRANEVYGAMPPERQAVARRILLRLTQPGEGTEDTRRRAARAELIRTPDEEPEVDAVLDALVGARLVTAGRDPASGEPVVEVTHEALIRGWPELRGWIDEDRDRLRAERRLSDAAAEWDRGGGEDGALYRGARLAAWQERDRSALNPAELQFLAASDALDGRERATRRRRTRIGVGVLGASAAVVAALAVFALVQRSDANTQKDLALSRQLAGSSTLALRRDPELATLLAESAYASAPTVEAEESLRQSVHDSKIRAELRMPDELALAAAPMPDGRTFVVAESGNARVWDAAQDPGGTSAEIVGKWPGGVSALGATPAGYVTGDNAGAIVLWPGRDAPGAPERVARVSGPVYRIRALPGGDRVIVAAEGGAFLVGLTDQRVDRIATGSMADALPDPTGGYLLARPLNGVERLRDGSPPAPVPLKGQPRALAISPDRTQLAVAADGGIEVMRSGPGPAPVFSAPVAGGANDVAWAPDGARVAVAGGTGVVQAYDREGRLLSRMTGHEGSVVAIGWADPTTVVSVGTDGTVRRWDVAAGVENQLKGHAPSAFGGVSFEPDGSRITVIRSDGSAERWTPAEAGTQALLPSVPPKPPVPPSAYTGTSAGGLVAVSLFDGRAIVRDASGDELVSVTVANDVVAGLAIDPGDRRLAIARATGNVEVVDLTPGARPRLVGKHGGGAFAVAYSPVDGTLASGGRDGTVKLWGGPGGDRTLGTHNGQVTSVAFSPDGRRLVSGSGDKTVRVWDVTGREPPRVIRTHQDSVWSVAFAGDDRVVSGGSDGVRVTDWRRGVTLLTIPHAANWVAAAGRAPAIAFYGDDNVVREIECDVCGPIDGVEAAARKRTTRGLTAAEQADFHIPN